MYTPTGVPSADPRFVFVAVYNGCRLQMLSSTTIVHYKQPRMLGTPNTSCPEQGLLGEPNTAVALLWLVVVGGGWVSLLDVVVWCCGV